MPGFLKAFNRAKKAKSGKPQLIIRSARKWLGEI